MSILYLPKIPTINNIKNEIRIAYKTPLYSINKTLQTYLQNVKGEIDNKQNEWDIYKKYTNPYEYIHTPLSNSKNSICKLKPLSRSFYKMIEICNSLNLLELLPNTYTSFHFAEGPGGFIEAMCHLTGSKNTHYGMTLIDNNDSAVPGWKKSKAFLKANPNVIIENAITNDGDMLQEKNLEYCYDKYNNKIDFVTADGGFDFSTNFNKQEICGLKLLIAQVLYALAVQKQGGHFILKVFDTFAQSTVDLIYILSSAYDQVKIIKPYTSRYANAEKYIVCINFKLDKDSNFSIIHNLKSILNIKNKIPTRLLHTSPPYYFTIKLEEINAILGQQQIENITSTLSLIEHYRTDKIENMKKINIQKCIVWCQKNKLPFNNSIQNANIFLDKSKLK